MTGLFFQSQRFENKTHQEGAKSERLGCGSGNGECDTAAYMGFVDIGSKARATFLK